ncbi:hypothetical protein HX776_11315 [Pseudomonas agarici]|uniref:DUF6708 domain-containing protein n=1 Tax=Pseudomonas agarici TaxID=46677 RepID=UPI0008CC82F0|nr:DUF6708 domain-containing protein [Pseudomonas agarici]NWC09401.1 hypothetical protein [Pseudomonas agarici]SEL48137.1 hypothetical protein SAMN05216604_119107 [Pseudomonas agarici]
MFLFERMMWSVKTESPEIREFWRKETAKNEENGSTAKVHVKKSSKQWRFYERASDAPTDANSLYAFDENHIDVRAAFQEEKRGLITFGFLAFGVGLNFYMFYAFVWVIINILVSDFVSGDSSGFGGWFFGGMIVSLWFVMNYFLWKYTWRWIRVELFTQRYLVARFNRITKQVYVSRPDYAGGITTLPWSAVIPAISPEDPDFMGMGGFLILGFLSEHTSAGYDETLMLGRPMHGNQELVGFWEFIRRYMEEGPQAVPKPKRLLTLRPTPIEPVRATLRFMSGFWRNGGKITALITGTLLSPLIVLHALCHWISLLLCWAPRWPKEIQEAGQPGKPIPKLTTAEDFGPVIGANLRANTLKERSETPMLERPGWRPAVRQQNNSDA